MEDLPSAAKVVSNRRTRPSRTAPGFMPTHSKYPALTQRTKNG